MGELLDWFRGSPLALQEGGESCGGLFPPQHRVLAGTITFHRAEWAGMDH